MFGYAGCDIPAHFGAQPIREAPRRVIHIAANRNLGKHGAGTWTTGGRKTRRCCKAGNFRQLKAIFLNRYHAAVALRAYELEAMECAPKWNDGAAGEGNRIGQAFKLPFEPVRVPRQKRARIVEPAPVWQRQDRGTLRMADLEGKSLRP